MALGVLYCNPAPSYDHQVYEQIAAASPQKRDINGLLRSGRTWKVE
jgi:hypothetical protein